MGRKDEYQFDYLEDDRRFADQINSALFNGRQIVKSEELEPDEAQMVSTGEKVGAGNIQPDRQRYNMCKASEDMKLEGIEIGMKRNWYVIGT